jgi:type IV pilus assembly protein PilA
VKPARLHPRTDRPSGCESGFTLIELVLVIAVISILAALAAPGLLNARRAGNETSAIASLNALVTAQELYANVCGRGGYASSFTVLGVPLAGTTAPLLAPDLTAVASPVKAGYQFTLTAGAGAVAGPLDCNGTATSTTFYGTAVPLTFGGTGGRSFATSSRRTIWQNAGAAAPSEPFGAPATPIQ